MEHMDIGVSAILTGAVWCRYFRWRRARHYVCDYNQTPEFVALGLILATVAWWCAVAIVHVFA